jgi:AbrB family looped-hinge helix DNA binding protein
METTRLSSKGQVVIPKSVRVHCKLEPGDEFSVEETDEGILLKPLPKFVGTELDQVFGCLAFSGRPRTLEEMEAGIRKGAEQFRDRC